MKRQRQEFVEDVESLVEKTVVEEAADIVWKTFEGALTGLDEDSLFLLRQHFEGRSIKELARTRNLPEKDVQEWLTKVKRNVLEGLRKEFPVRQ